MHDLTRKILSGDERAAARLMRAVEDDLASAVPDLAELYKHTGNACIIGITGAPGVGKSTLLNALITDFRKRMKTVGVVAIDPTSPFTGGALLGDRVRMGKHAADKGVFIRSLASRGWVGGLARAAIGVIHILDAMGKDIILVEAVGSGQGEVVISRMADTTVVVLSPGAGDEIQMLKAGILEVADVYVINKADLDGAENLKVQLETMCSMTTSSEDGWRRRVMLTQAVNGTGISTLAKALLKHHEYLVTSGEIEQRRLERAVLELSEAIEYGLRQKTNTALVRKDIKKTARQLVKKQIDPYTASSAVLQRAMDSK